MRSGERGVGRNTVLILIGATLIVLVVVIRIGFSREVMELLNLF
jgi:hypothetical protein